MQCATIVLWRPVELVLVGNDETWRTGGCPNADVMKCQKKYYMVLGYKKRLQHSNYRSITKKKERID